MPSLEVVVSSPAEFDVCLNQHIVRGYQVRRSGPAEALLCKPRPAFNWALFVVLFLFTCGIGNVIQVIAYLANAEQWATIKLASPEGGQSSVQSRAPASGSPGPAPDAGPNVSFNESRSHWFNGQSWRDARVEVPPGAKIDTEKRAWWDGASWRPLPED